MSSPKGRLDDTGGTGLDESYDDYAGEGANTEYPEGEGDEYYGEGGYDESGDYGGGDADYYRCRMFLLIVIKMMRVPKAKRGEDEERD
jgi:hypothetical protein